tara:strand:+ start:2054 stop:2911 length:858 start_codon:yes stop_codon:yes gene_type:complete
MKKSNKYISIIMQTKNSEEFLHETFNSILKQDITLDIFIADADSNDKTLEIINKYKKYLNIEVVSKYDSGQSDALNKGVNSVNTPYFLTIGSDDIILPYTIKEFINIIKSGITEEYLYISSDTFIFNKEKILKYNFGSVQRKLFVNNGIWFGPFPSVIWNTKIVKSIGAFREDLHFSMDYELVQRYNKLYNNNKINLHLNKICGGFRLHSKSKTTSSEFDSLFKKEQKSIEREYKLNRSKKLILKIIYNFLSLPRYRRYLLFNKKIISNYLKVIKNKNIELIRHE